MGPDTMASGRRPLFALLLTATAILSGLAWWALPFLTDDAFISMRYAERLLAGRGLSWTDNLEPVEGYSNLSWVLLTAGLGALGLSLDVAVRWLGVVFHLLTLPALVAAFRPRPGESWIPATLAVLTFACSVPIGIWTVGGLEQPLVACSLAWGLALATRLLSVPTPGTALLASLPFGVLAVTRPDGLLFTGVVALSLLVRWRHSRVDLVRYAPLLVGPVALAGAQLMFRLVYYGAWVPNTAHAKLTGSLKHALDGLAYVGGGFVGLAPISLLAAGFMVWALVRRTERRAEVALYAACGAAWAAYLVLIGGDIFPGWRHHVPLVVVSAFLLGELGLALLRRVSDAGARRLWFGVLALFPLYLGLQLANDQNQRAFAEEWEWDSVAAGTLLRELFEDTSPVLAVDAAGATVYASGLPALDMLGLNDGWLAKNRPASFGTGRIGHELGDGAYIFSKRPDLVAFGYQFIQWPYERGARELAALPEFVANYTFTRMSAGAPRPFEFGVWVLRESERIGVRRSAGRVEVPAWLLNGDEASRVTGDGTGGAVVRATTEVPARVLALDLPAGTWRPTGIGDGQLTPLVTRGTEVLPLEAGVFTLAGPGEVDVALSPPPGVEVAVSALVIERTQ
jgi:arabinofuranosyltransferase